MSTLAPRFQITSDDIDTVMRRFYARIRAHEVLGPIFAAHVSEWPEHEAKIGRFWKKAILHEDGYSGNPMMTHMGVAQMRAHHFDIWLGLFDEVLTETLAPTPATSFSALAHRIGRGLRLGIEDRDKPKGTVPIFT
ncbi:group III truncated hemoglobin [Lentibacter sp. XHP0401]|jgi:hemoglobin|uniref:group III truncated hemoglobin n=1 Tax=Lentibacter sp. XHP0401 TaxID=2984334 RepID=UPI0021E977B6|nr:group III truncated hemoglobin [Lentibacter sp. XHP0401]MCV2894165.1 group III truncated hemoglobin [Lentibacter sp. XHP0401]